MNQNITLKQIKEFKIQTNSNSIFRLARNTALNSEIEDLAMDWESFRKINHTFSDIVSGEMPDKSEIQWKVLGFCRIEPISHLPRQKIQSQEI